VNIIYSTVHSLKGNSSLLDFQYIAEKAHTLEEVIKSLTLANIAGLNYSYQINS